MTSFDVDFAAKFEKRAQHWNSKNPTNYIFKYRLLIISNTLFFFRQCEYEPNLFESYSFEFIVFLLYTQQNVLIYCIKCLRQMQMNS